MKLFKYLRFKTLRSLINETRYLLDFSLHHSHQYKIANVKMSESDNHFDVIVLAQQWPVTVCLFDNKTLNPGGGCNLPKEKKRWTIHGIWPRNIGGEYVEFCNETWAFDLKQIKSIKRGLMQAQFGIFKEYKPYKFWAKEWRKHGTCAAVLEPFNTQLKYFSKSIEWNQKYPLSEMLEAANIFPSDTTYLDPEKVANAVKAQTKKNPMIGCYVIEEVTYLQEVRICLDKEFNVMDCKLPVVDSNCYSPKGLIYPVNA